MSLNENQVIKLEADIPQTLHTELSKFFGTHGELDHMTLLAYVAHEVAQNSTDDEWLEFAEKAAEIAFDNVDGYDPTPMHADCGV